MEGGDCCTFSCLRCLGAQTSRMQKCLQDTTSAVTDLVSYFTGTNAGTVSDTDIMETNVGRDASTQEKLPRKSRTTSLTRRQRKQLITNELDTVTTAMVIVL